MSVQGHRHRVQRRVPQSHRLSGPTGALASCSNELPGFDQGVGGITGGDAAPVRAFYGHLDGVGGDAGSVLAFACDTP